MVADGLNQPHKCNIETGQLAHYNFRNTHRHLEIFNAVDTSVAHKHSPLTDIWIGAIKRIKSTMFQYPLLNVFKKHKMLFHLPREASGGCEDKLFCDEGSSTSEDTIFVETDHPGPHSSRYNTAVANNTTVHWSFTTHGS